MALPTVHLAPELAAPASQHGVSCPVYRHPRTGDGGAPHDTLVGTCLVDVAQWSAARWVLAGVALLLDEVEP